MAAIDTVLSHLLGHQDVLVTSRNIYGGAHQLIHDWYGKSANLEIAVESFDGFTVDDFDRCWQATQAKYSDRFSKGLKAYLYLESPCNPHGYVLDVPQICRRAHEYGLRVILDSTIGTPFLVRPLRREDPLERPDFVLHSYTKDLSGSGTVIAGVVIGRNEDMFLPKGQSVAGHSWENTLFWNVYYVKGAFLNADAAFEVLQGIRTLEVRMLAKCINTQILVRFLDSHPRFTRRQSSPGNSFSRCASGFPLRLRWPSAETASCRTPGSRSSAIGRTGSCSTAGMSARNAFPRTVRRIRSLSTSRSGESRSSAIRLNRHWKALGMSSGLRNRNRKRLRRFENRLMSFSYTGDYLISVVRRSCGRPGRMAV